MKSVTLTLAPATFVVNGNSNEELLENAKKALTEQLTNSIFPHITYAINDADVLTHESAFPGMIVETNNGDKGIITAVNRKNLNVTLTKHRSVSGPPQAFKKSSATFSDARSLRHEIMKPDWFEGDTGYIKTREGIREFVVGKKSGKKTKIHIIGLNKFVSLTEEQMEIHLKDNKNELK
ncbi:cupredoxin domain-containing protein [Bacillus cihuensis]|uniref:hypothetical protein n=1 Tax=Bacillus cihuensis TaxID=1208599 RepID=UPI000426505D|nr:hypothetical protein [Bacillus cihuensis]